MTDRPPDRRLAVVINPVKFPDVGTVRDNLQQVADAQGWPEIVWYETTVEEPGLSQARQAVEEGASLVAALGGDGTLRSVASGLVGTTVPLGLLPAGTGNLLARNLGLPFTDVTAALEVALAGVDRAIDVGLVSWDGRAAEVFLVIAGLGLDAETVANANDTLKRVAGWLAYVESGVKALFSSGFRVRVTADGSTAVSQHARTVMIGNCGELQGGAAIMPEAEMDDGLLNVMLVAPNSVVGWGAVLLDLVTRHNRGHQAIRRMAARRISVRTRRPVEGQLDGDAVGPVTAMECEVRERALLVRVAPAADADRKELSWNTAASIRLSPP